MGFPLSYHEVDSRVQGILNSQESFGFDEDQARIMQRDLSFDVMWLDEVLMESLGSDTQVTQGNFIGLLQGKYSHWSPSEFTSKGNPSMTWAALELMPFKEAEDMKQVLLKRKILSYLGQWLEFSNNGRIGHTCNVAGTSTSRVSHRDPNLGAIPSPKGFGERRELGARCRELFCPPTGMVQVGVDVSGLELGMLAHYLHMFDGGRYAQEFMSNDIHSYNRVMFGFDKRDTAKLFMLMWLYGAGSNLISKKLGITSTQSVANLCENIGGLSELKGAIQGRCERDGFFTTMLGRKIACPDRHKALNYLLQSAGAEFTKVWILYLHKLIRRQGYVYGRDWHQAAFVFDEVQLFCRPSIADDIARLAGDAIGIASKALNLHVTLKGESKIGNNWRECH